MIPGIASSFRAWGRLPLEELGVDSGVTLMRPPLVPSLFVRLEIISSPARKRGASPETRVLVGDEGSDWNGEGGCKSRRFC
jgi:hypothetical protein